MNAEFREKLENLIIDGIESGIVYWATLYNDTPEFDKYYQTTDLATSEIVAKLILDDKFPVKIAASDGTKEKYSFSLERLYAGIGQNTIERPWDSDLDNYDSITSDCIFQYAIFGDVIFG